MKQCIRVFAFPYFLEFTSYPDRNKRIAGYENRKREKQKQKQILNRVLGETDIFSPIQDSIQSQPRLRDNKTFPLKPFNWLYINHWCSYHISMSSVIHCWTDGRQHGRSGKAGSGLGSLTSCCFGKWALAHTHSGRNAARPERAAEIEPSSGRTSEKASAFSSFPKPEILP